MAGQDGSGGVVGVRCCGSGRGTQGYRAVVVGVGVDDAMREAGAGQGFSLLISNIAKIHCTART